jgi:uncharacterized damage-inducible protein DinB
MSGILQILRELYDHMEWADATVWRAVLACPAAEGDAALRRRLVHIHTVQRAFLSVWRGETPHFRESFDSLRDVAEWGREYYAGVRPHVAAAGGAALDRIVVLPWAEQLSEVFGRKPDPTTLRDTMLQIPMHSIYHRGQVNTRLRELGGEPPLVDFIAWIWSGKPAAEWPS